MDPLSQGLIGAVAGQSKANKSHMVYATIFGLLAGMSADLDVLIRSQSDPLLAIQFHRHFTHSLVFIPLGALLCAGVFYWVFRAKKKGFSFKAVYLYCLLGYATHGLLDSFTGYGTQLFWPFSDYRVAWNAISIIDPLFTLPLLLVTIASFIFKKRQIAIAGFIYAVCYLAFGVTQQHRAESYVKTLIEHRGHQAQKINVKPTLGNLLVWRSTYEHRGRFYVDGIRVAFAKSYFAGQSVAKLDVARDVPWLKSGAAQSQDIERFRHFANGYLAIHPDRPEVIADIRYSMLPQTMLPLWGIQLDQNKLDHEHALFIDFERDKDSARQAAGDLWEMITGRNPGTQLH